MAAERIAALIVPTSDPHNSEYVAPRFQYRAKLSNFYGSAGTAVVTPDKELLWTDGRYWLEAEKSLPAGWVLQRAGMAGIPAMEDWLEEELFVGVDPYTYSAKAWEALAQGLERDPRGVRGGQRRRAPGRAVDALLLTALDDIAWLTNVRDVSEVPYNPVFIAYAVADVHEKKIHLFTNHREATPEEDADKAKRIGRSGSSWAEARLAPLTEQR